MTKKLTETQLNTMLDLQDHMNNKVNKDWRNAGYAWRDAIFMEASEAFAHSGYKWWKDIGKDLDINQIKLEIVDIWHFIISDMMTYKSPDPKHTYFQLVSGIIDLVKANEPPRLQKNTHGLQVALKGLINTATLPDDGDESGMGNIIADFCVVMTMLDMGWDELFKLYVSKNVLNIFRQNHGYKEGTYIKNWAGAEDNEVLTAMVNNMDINSENFMEDLNTKLEKQYEYLTGPGRSTSEREVGTEYAYT